MKENNNIDGEEHELRDVPNILATAHTHILAYSATHFRRVKITATKTDKLRKRDKCVKIER